MARPGEAGFNPRSAPKRGATEISIYDEIGLFVSIRAPRRSAERHNHKYGYVETRKFQSALRAERLARKQLDRRLRDVSIRAPRRSAERQLAPEHPRHSDFVSIRAPRRSAERRASDKDNEIAFVFQSALRAEARSDSSSPCRWPCGRSFNPRSAPKRGATRDGLRLAERSFRVNPRSAPKRGATSELLNVRVRLACFNPRSAPKRGATAALPNGRNAGNYVLPFANVGLHVTVANADLSKNERKA
jgi:hypothetical protein